MRMSNTLSKVTAFLCVLLVVFSLIAFIEGNPTKRIDYLNARIHDCEEQIVQNEKDIADLQEQISKLEQIPKTDLPSAQAALQKAKQDVATQEASLLEAEKDLDKVCSRSSYSNKYCGTKCNYYHLVVTSRKMQLDNAKLALTNCQNTVNSIEKSIKKIADDILTAEMGIQNAQSKIVDLKIELARLHSALEYARVFSILKALAMLFVLIAFVLLAINFCAKLRAGLTLCALIFFAVSSLCFLAAGTIDVLTFGSGQFTYFMHEDALLTYFMRKNGHFAYYAYENTLLVYLLSNPHIWNLVVVGLFMAALPAKAKKPAVLRNIAIVFALIVGMLIVARSSPVLGVLYVVTMICAAFVIEPLVFTEYIDIAKHIFLTFITYGIWQLVWTYCVTRNLNRVETVESRKPVRELLLCMFLPFYYPYWLYKTAEGVEDYGKARGKAFKIDFLCILFSFICPLFATILIQNKVNVIAGKPGLAKAAPVENCQ